MANTIEIRESPAQAVLGDVITVNILWRNDVPALAFVGLYEPPDYTTEPHTFERTPLREPGFWSEDVWVTIDLNNTLGVNQIWVLLQDENYNLLTEFVGPRDINILLQLPQEPPITPTLVSPANNASIENQKPKFDWNNVEGASTYDIQICDRADFIRNIIDMSLLINSEYTPATALPNNNYYWRVRAKNQYGTSAWSIPWLVTINASDSSYAPRYKPVLHRPQNDSTPDTGTPKFEWISVPRATQYHLQIAKNNDLSEMVIEQRELTLTEFTPQNTLPTGKLYWRVRGKNNDGNGPWSDIWSFTIGAGEGPGAPPAQDFVTILEAPGTANIGTSIIVKARWGTNVRHRVFLSLREHPEYKNWTSFSDFEVLQPGTYERELPLNIQTGTKIGAERLVLELIQVRTGLPDSLLKTASRNLTVSSGAGPEPRPKPKGEVPTSMLMLGGALLAALAFIFKGKKK